MATKSSKSLWISPMATTDSGGSAGAFAGPAHPSTADTRTRRTKIQRRWGETQTGRTIFLPPMGKQQNSSEKIEFRRAPSIAVHLRLPELHKSTSGIRTCDRGRHTGGLQSLGSKSILT